MFYFFPMIDAGFAARFNTVLLSAPTPGLRTKIPILPIAHVRAHLLRGLGDDTTLLEF